MMQKKKMLLMIGLIIGGWAMQHPQFTGDGGNQPPEDPTPDPPQDDHDDQQPDEEVNPGGNNPCEEGEFEEMVNAMDQLPYNFRGPVTPDGDGIPHLDDPPVGHSNLGWCA